MPAEVEASPLGPSCWELKVKLIPRQNDPRSHEFCAFLTDNKLHVDKDYGWNARGYQALTILVGSRSRAQQAKKLIEQWGEKNLPK